LKKKTKETHKKWLYGVSNKSYSLKWNGKEYIEYILGIANPKKGNPKYIIGKLY